MNMQHHPTQSRYVARVSCDLAHVAKGLEMRARQYRGRGRAELDTDAFDDRCHHIVIHAEHETTPRAYVRLRRHTDRHSVLNGYCGQRYDLRSFCPASPHMVEMGRLCLAPEGVELNVLRSLWGVISACIAQWRATHVFGCHSFDGLNTKRHAGMFSVLTRGHLTPDHWQVAPRSAEQFAMSQVAASAPNPPERANSLTQIYRSFGAKFADHGTFDHDLARLHVFACLQITQMPATRRRILQRLANETAIITPNRIDVSAPAQ